MYLLVSLGDYCFFYDSHHFAEGVEVDEYTLMSIQSDEESFCVLDLVFALLVQKVSEVVIGFGAGVVG